MSEHGATLEWQLAADREFTYDNYNRDHSWQFKGGHVVPASSGVAFGGNPDNVNPDEAVIAACAGCHLLTFLAIAAKKKLKVISYTDHPTGTLDKNEEGRTAIVQITLRPKVQFAADTPVDDATLAALHDSAHRNCFVANSLRCPVHIKPVYVVHG